MCTPSIADKVFGIDPPQAPQVIVQAPPPPPPLSQASRQPDQAALRSAQQGRLRGPGGSSSPTMWSGPGGVDPALLSIGRNTLLGGT